MVMDILISLLVVEISQCMYLREEYHAPIPILVNGSKWIHRPIPPLITFFPFICFSDSKKMDAFSLKQL